MGEGEGEKKRFQSVENIKHNITERCAEDRKRWIDIQPKLTSNFKPVVYIISSLAVSA